MLHRYARDKAKPITFPSANCSFNKPLVITAPRLNLQPLSILGLATLLALFLLPYTAKAAKPVSAQVTSQAQWLQPEDQTMALAKLLAQYQRADKNGQAELEEDLINLAADRQHFLLTLIKKNPGKVLQQALPRQLLAGAPPKVRSYLEQHVELEGTLEVVYEDYAETSHLRHFLKTEGKRFSLHFTDRPPSLHHGAKVGVRGVVVEDSLALSPEETDLQILNLGEDNELSSASNSSVETLPGTFGEQRTVVLLVNFQDNPTDQPWTVEEAQDLVFGTVSDFYLENSFGQTWLTGDVYGWYTLPFDQPTDSMTCKSTEVARLAQEAATAAGVDLTAFDRYIYVFPQTSCFPSGSGTVGGTPSETWINGDYFKLKTVGHELGHNLGLFHSAALECGDMSLGNDCQVFPYGDRFDIMGNTSSGHFNAFQKERLGWLDANLGHIAVSDVAGTYSLATYENGEGSVPKVLKVLKEIDPVTAAKTWYYIEHRQAFGFDDFLAGNENVLSGVIVRMATETVPGSSVLLDVTPNSDSLWDWLDPALEFGLSFFDPETGMMITSQSGGDSTATVEVSFVAPDCVQANPTVAVSPAESQWEAPGTPMAYTVTVTNEDSNYCSGSYYDLTAGFPVGWTAVYDTEPLYLEPGASTSTVLEVTSSPTTADDTYLIDVTVQNSNDFNYWNSASITCVVISEPSQNTAPVPVDDSTTTLQETPILIDVLSNDMDPDGDPLTVTSVDQGEGGSVSINTDGTIRYSPNPRFKGADNFLYTVSDGDLSSNAVVTVMVEREKSGGKGKSK